MGKKLTDLRNILYAVTGLEAVFTLIFREALGKYFWAGILSALVQLAILYYLFDRFESYMVERSSTVRDSINDAATEAFLYGEVGMVGYDDEHVVTWMSDLFEKRGINRVERKLLPWLPEADDLVSGVSDKATAMLDDRIYEITKKEDDRVLFFRDITEKERYKQKYNDERPVVGLASLDNYEESTQYEDEAVVSAINVAVRTPLTEYCKEHGILIRRVNNYRYMLMLNEKIYSELVADHFSIVNTVRKAAQKQDVTITLSMAFAMDAPSYQQLDDMVTRLLDLAQARGGDQVAVQRGSNDVKYYGGSSEAAEKRSRVRVRVMAHSLRELIARSSNVIICGHKEMDFDCLGSALGMARICEAMNRPCVIIEKTGGIEEKLKAAVTRHLDALNEEVHFVTESEALNQLQEKTLTVMVDHYSAKTSNGQKVLEASSRVAIIDHHRRENDIGVKPVFVYIEAGASSACELITELIPYISNRIELSEIDATFMLAGMTIDTQRFRTRTGVRTFEAASALRRMGANQQLVDEYLKDSYSEFALRAKIISCSKRVREGIVVVPFTESIITRTMVSQAADSLLDIRNVDAVFVIANIDEETTAVSARSNGTVNVQRIMEMMQGGGHMTMAAVQLKDTTVDKTEALLKEKLEEYFEETEDEGNTEN